MLVLTITAGVVLGGIVLRVLDGAVTAWAAEPTMREDAWKLLVGVLAFAVLVGVGWWKLAS